MTDSAAAPGPGTGTGTGTPGDATGLAARVVVERPAFRLDVTLAVAPGEVVALLGPNGAGKTTALRALAGLEPLTAGHVTLDGVALEDPAARRHVPPERRPIGMVFSDHLLFPHLTALENVAFGPRSRGARAADARAAAAAWLERVGLSAHARSRPRALSGGQAQRVALARALVTGPRLLLLDEPLAALDARTRADTRAALRTHLAAFAAAAVLVTHDPLDAMVLADRVVVVEDGRIVQEGTPAYIARHPRTDYVARLVGLNLYRGLVRGDGHEVETADGVRFTLAEAVGRTAVPGTAQAPAPRRTDGRPEQAGPGAAEAFVAFAPSAVALHAREPSGSPRNRWPVTVRGVEPHGDRVRVDLDGPPGLAADVTPAAVAELGLVPGARVWAAVKATEVRGYPAG